MSDPTPELTDGRHLRWKARWWTRKNWPFLAWVLAVLVIAILMCWSVWKGLVLWALSILAFWAAAATDRVFITKRPKKEQP